MSEVIARVLTTSSRSSITHESYAALEPTQPDRASRLKHRGSVEGGPREHSRVPEKQGSRRRPGVHHAPKAASQPRGAKLTLGDAAQCLYMQDGRDRFVQA